MKIYRDIISSNLEGFIVPEFKSCFMNAIKENWNYLSKGVNLDNLHGCGGWGCAFETNNPHWTAKITINDVDEINFYKKSQKLGSDIFAKIGNIEVLSGCICGRGCVISLVLREAAFPLNESDDPEIVGLCNFLEEGNNIYSIEARQLHGERVKSFIDECIQLERWKGIEIGDMYCGNIGLSEVDGRIIIFDGWLVQDQKQN